MSDNLNFLFPRTYPIQNERGEAPALFTKEFEHNFPIMQVHVTRSHFGEILIGAASTAQTRLPKRYREDRFHHHLFPTYHGDSWKTRFDGGNEGGMPHIVAALYVTQGEPDSNDECYWTELDKVYVKIVVTGTIRIEHYVYVYSNNWVLNDDGLELIHAALECVKSERNKVDMKDIPDYVLESLHWATDHIDESFGQGKIPRKRS